MHFQPGFPAIRHEGKLGADVCPVAAQSVGKCAAFGAQPRGMLGRDGRGGVGRVCVAGKGKGMRDGEGRGVKRTDVG